MLNALPTRQQAAAREALTAIYTAQSRAVALEAVQAFAARFAAWPKAIAKISDELDTLLAFFDYPAEHAIHLRTTNPIESTFATVRLRTRVTKGAGSRAAGLAMTFKLAEAAQARWRRINAPQLVAVVRAGARFIDGQLPERREEPKDEAANGYAA